MWELRKGNYLVGVEKNNIAVQTYCTWGGKVVYDLNCSE